MPASRIEGDVYVNGDLRSKTLTIPDGTIINADVNASADIAASKVEQHLRLTWADEYTVSASDREYPIHCVRGATGTLVNFEIGALQACAGDATVDVDLKVGTSSVLAAAAQLTSAQTARAIVTATISTTGVTDGAVIAINIDADTGTAGTVAKGLFATLCLDEDYS